MKFSGLPVLALSLASCVCATLDLSFGKHYAVLNLDLITDIINLILPSPVGPAFLANEATWVNAVQALSPQPLTIWTRIYFTNPTNPEIGPNTPFAKAIAPLLPLQETSPGSMVYPEFNVLPNDTVLTHTRYYAGSGNPLEEILKAQGIDTVILTGLRTSGIILATAYRLFDLDFNVYIISNCTLEPPPMADAIQTAILGTGGIVEKLPATVITLEEAVAAIKK